MQPISQELLQQAKAGDETAMAALIARMMPLIRKGAWSNRAPGLDFEDAVQEGLIGLFDALRRYDAAQGVPFAGFAALCIQHAQQDARRAAQGLGCSPKAVENALARARRKLRASAP